MRAEPPPGVRRSLAHPVVHRIAERLRGREAVSLADESGARRAAVALILRVNAEEAPELLLIQRATYEGDPWSGQVGLPGGRQEPGDTSLEATAVRETCEETGIDLACDGWLIGRLDDLKPGTVTLPRLIITPFVFVLGGEVTIVLSPELAEAFWVPLAALQEPAASQEVVLELPSGPRRVTGFRHAGYTIWGLTERILRQLLALSGPA